MKAFIISLICLFVVLTAPFLVTRLVILIDNITEENGHDPRRL